MTPRWKLELEQAVGPSGPFNLRSLSRAAGLNETYVRDLLKRDKNPTVDKFVALARALGRSPGAMLDEEEAQEAHVVAAPLLNWVSAGRLMESAPTPPGETTVYLSDLGPGDYFALTVSGTSMNRVSPEGSTIIVNRREVTPQRGKPYVFAIRGEATYKLWEPSPPRLEPYSTDPTNKPIFIDKKSKLFVVGRVRRTILDL